MDPITQAALMSKAVKVFGSEGTFLSFPLTPISYKKEDLELDIDVQNSEVIAKRYRNLEAFSVLTNLIPEGEFWNPAESKFLWNEYGYVLAMANCASSTRSEKEELQYQAAKEYLSTDIGDGILEDSVPVVVYNQYKDAFYMLSQDFKAREIDALTSIDDEVKQQWQNVDEKLFREKLQLLNSDWIVKGYKEQVEIARNTLETLGARSPVLTWADWKQKYNVDIDSYNSSSTQLDYFPSRYAPTNALDEGSWRPFQLDANTIKALVQEMPAELKKQLSLDTAENKIEHLSLEFSSAVVTRHWFDPEVFKSRFWHFTDASKVLSNGETPPSGDCPSYVTAIVFARKIVVTTGSGSQSQHAEKQQISFEDKLLRHEMLHRKTYLRRKAHLRSLHRKELIRHFLHLLNLRKAQLQTQRPSIKATNEVVYMARSMPFRPIAMTLQIEPQASIATPERLVRTRRVERYFQSTTEPIEKAAETPDTPEKTLQRRRHTLGRAGSHLGRERQSNRVIEHSKKLERISKKYEVPVIATTNNLALTKPLESHELDDSIFVLAFICKPLPQCPNPDTNLQW